MVSHPFVLSNASTVVLKLIGNARYLLCPVIEMLQFCADCTFMLFQSYILSELVSDCCLAQFFSYIMARTS